jgi:hypothetical protein
LHTEIGKLALAPLPVLSGTVVASVDRAFGPSKNILAEPAIEFVFRLSAFRHVESPKSSSSSSAALNVPPHRETRLPLPLSG